MKACVLLILLLGITCAMGCSDDDYARFQATDGDALPSCMADQFPLELTFLAAKSRNGRLGLYLQSPSDARGFHDGLIFRLYDPDSLGSGDAVEIEDTATSPPSARGALFFFSSCAHGQETLKVQGSLQFDEFEPEAGGIIAGQLIDGRAVNARTGEPVIGELTGEFSFTVRRAPPYEDFYIVPEWPESP